MARLKAFWLGVRDGFASPSCLSSGLTWDDCCLNEAYDHGVNLGQRIGSVVKRVEREV